MRTYVLQYYFGKIAARDRTRANTLVASEKSYAELLPAGRDFRSKLLTLLEKVIIIKRKEKAPTPKVDASRVD